MQSKKKPTASRLGRLFSVFLGILLGISVSEALLRGWRQHRGWMRSARAQAEYLEGALATSARFVPKNSEGSSRPPGQIAAILHPYSGAENWHDTGGVLAYFRERARPQDYEIVVMGGSVAMLLADYLIEHPPPEWVEAAQQQGGKLVVLNYAHATYKQPQQVGRLSYLLSFGYQPDVVLEIDGFNEVALALENAIDSQVNPLYPSAPNWGGVLPNQALDNYDYARIVGGMLIRREDTLAQVQRAAELGLLHSAIVSHWLEFQVKHTLRAINAGRVEFFGLWANESPTKINRELRGPDYDTEPHKILDLCVEAWRQGSISMQALCQARRIRYVHMLQPTLFDQGSKRLDDSEVKIQPPSLSWREGPRRGYPRLRQVGTTLAARGIEFIDASRCLAEVSEPLYYDSCHMVDRGSELWLEAVGDRLIQAVFPNLVLAAPPGAAAPTGG
jgi:hypothetical protein